MAALWVEAMASAVRAVDDTHLVTVGMTSGSLPFQSESSARLNELFVYSAMSPLFVARSLDFVSVHDYPSDAETIDLAEQVLRGGHGPFPDVDGGPRVLPVVLEETLPLLPGDLEARFFSRVRRSAAGAMSFYWGKTPGELRTSGDASEAVIANWVDRYADFVRGWQSDGATRTEGIETIELSVTEQMLDAAARADTAARFVDIVDDNSVPDVVLLP